MFEEKNKISDVALNILRKRYFHPGETTWEELTDRVIKHVCSFWEDSDAVRLTREMILNRYFIPNSPCLVNSGKESSGLAACFVVDFPDTIEGIYKTKLDFAKIARKGGGCGTDISHLRPENARVAGSTHGYAGGGLKFADTISHDMDAMTQAGFRSMAMMLTCSVYYPDILKFITAKEEEGKIANANISVIVDNNFLEKVEKDEEYQTYFDYEDRREYGPSYRAKDIFNLIVEGMWRNGEPGILFRETIDNSPYKYTGQEIFSTNPCSEQPLPRNGVCNLGSLDISKFLNNENFIDFNKLETATRLGVRFLNSVADISSYPTEDIEDWVWKNYAIGLGIMGFADFLLKREIAYGSPESLHELEFILSFIYKIAEDESIKIGEETSIPEYCALLPVPRRNITLLTVAPTGTISLLAGCSSGIEPIFSEITIRNDKTGSYSFVSDLAEKPYFRCAVSANGAIEVTWEEHVKVLASAQKWVDSGVSKTINFPNHTHKDTMAKAVMLAWKLGCKGVAMYRNGSRKVEVLSPKAIKKDLCPICKSELIQETGCKKCSNPECGFRVCES